MRMMHNSGPAGWIGAFGRARRAGLCAGLAPVLLSLAAGVALGQDPAPTKDEQGQGFVPAEPQDWLSAGDVAPALDVQAWLKGEPIKAFEPGTIYVIDFWSTWCQPCIRLFPHHSRLQRQYAQQGVRFVGVAVWENANPLEGDDYLPRVRAMVEKQGELMDYTVGYADPQNLLASRWLGAANRTSIPAAFIVGRDGKLAWIGHPMFGMEEALAALVAGNFDPGASAQRERELFEKRRQGTLLGISLQQKVEAEDWRGALSLAEDILALDSRIFAPTAVAKLRLQLVKLGDAQAGHAFARECLEKLYPDDAAVLRDLAFTVLEAPAGPARDMALAVALAQRAEDLSAGAELDVRTTQVLVRALLMDGQRERALAAIDRAQPRASDDEAKAALRAMREQVEQTGAANVPANAGGGQ